MDAIRRSGPKNSRADRWLCFNLANVPGRKPPEREFIQASIRAASVQVGRVSIRPAAANLARNVSPISASQTAVSRGMGWAAIWAASNASTWRHTPSAVFLSTLPNRIVFLVPSGATNKIRLLPFPSCAMDAIRNLRFMPLR